MATKPKAAELSGSLLARKGAAAPAADMKPRAAEPAREAASSAEAPGVPLNFRVPPAFRRAFKVYAAERDMKQVDLLQVVFEHYRTTKG